MQRFRITLAIAGVLLFARSGAAAPDPARFGEPPARLRQESVPRAPHRPDRSVNGKVGTESDQRPRRGDGSIGWWGVDRGM
jgi:hypothetical protein